MTTLHDAAVRGFASDNYSGVHPDVLAAIVAANDGHQVAYGEDAYTARLQEVFAHHFGEGVQAFPVFNGTGANVTGLQSMLPRWGAVIAASTAHINVDEGGAPKDFALEGDAFLRFAEANGWTLVPPTSVLKSLAHLTMADLESVGMRLGMSEVIGTKTERVAALGTFKVKQRLRESYPTTSIGQSS